MDEAHRGPDAIFRGSLVAASPDHSPSCGVRLEFPQGAGDPTITELEPPEGFSFGWGNAAEVGAQVTADAVLTAAVGYVIGERGWAADMSLAFCGDVLACIPQHEEWALSRDSVLWWVRGWYVGRGVEVPPTEALDLTPAVIPDQ